MFKSSLFDEKSFYKRFTQDLSEAKEIVIIESPYITVPRLRILKNQFERLIRKGIRVFFITKYPEEHDTFMADHSEAGIRYFEELGAKVLLCEGHHRKIAMIDGKIMWEGSLNILSHTHSREFMRRIEDKNLTEETFKFLKYDQVKFFMKGGEI